MLVLQKVKTYHSFIISTLLHLLVVAALLQIFSNKNKISFTSNIAPVAVINGQEFEKMQEKFFKKTKKSPILQKDKSATKTLAQNTVSNIKKGSKNSKLNHGQDFSAKNDENTNNNYANLIANKIEQNKNQISMGSAPNDVQTKIMLKVILDENGQLKSYKIVQNSNYRFFNKAAAKIVEISAPFPKPPVELSNSLEFHIPIVFDTVA